ncbi:MAG: histidine phosphatase family protein [Chloroflexi bacterium]|nr:MAG: histidine phosphatase family protein [Chloroflexota bacterium]
MTHLYLIRHGEATSQVQAAIRDDGLTPLGIRQAQRLRDRLATGREIVADVLIASTLPRARQTAEIIAPALGLPIVFDDEVQEFRIGAAAENMSFKELEAKYGKPDFQEDPFHPATPDGENWPRFVLRVSTALDRITRQYEGKSIVIVCHGGVIDCSFIYFFGMDTLRMPRTHFYTQNTSITHWRKDAPYEVGRAARWRLVRYNDNLHVRDLDAPARIPWEALIPARQSETRPVPPSAAPSEE